MSTPVNNGDIALCVFRDPERARAVLNLALAAAATDHRLICVFYGNCCQFLDPAKNDELSRQMSQLHQFAPGAIYAEYPLDDRIHALDQLEWASVMSRARTVLLA